VADTVGTAVFWDRVRELHLSGHREPEPRLVPYRPELRPVLRLERYNRATVMAPVELDTALREMILDLRRNRRLDPHQCGAFVGVLDELRHEWQALWVQHGPGKSGWLAYRQQLQRTRARMAGFPSSLTLDSTGYPVQDAVDAILQDCLDTMAAGGGAEPVRSGARRIAGPRYDRPVFIVAAPRSGSTLLFETLAENRAFWTLGDESHRQIEGIAALHPRARVYASNRLQAEDVSDETAGRLYEAFRADLRNAEGTRYLDLPVAERPASLRFLEKTPKNALRIPFLRALFPDARFIYLYRNPRDNLSSLFDSWRSGRFRTYPDLPGWIGEPWSHLLIPGWQGLIGKPLAEIVAAQWRITHEIILQDLAGVPESDWQLIAYEALLADAAGEIERLCRFCEVPFGPHMRTLVTQPLRHSRYTLTTPGAEKWRANATELEVALPQVAGVEERLAELFTRRLGSAGSRAEVSN
jgi:hypothetical protein